MCPCFGQVFYSMVQLMPLMVISFPQITDLRQQAFKEIIKCESVQQIKKKEHGGRINVFTTWKEILKATRKKGQENKYHTL